MSKSLQEQLLAAGLVNKQKAAKVKQEQTRKRKSSKGKKVPVLTEAERRARQAAALDAERSRELNRQRIEAAEKKAIEAQAAQLLDQHMVDRAGAEIAYRFSHDNKIRQIMVTASLQQSVVAGSLAIVHIGERYELLPSEIAERVEQRVPGSLVLRNMPPAQAQNDDDPYAEYQVPDDLMW